MPNFISYSITTQNRSKMSKQQQAKDEQGYNPKPIHPMCSNCTSFKSEFVKAIYHDYSEEKNIRCELGGFAVKKQGTCNKHEFKTT